MFHMLKTWFLVLLSDDETFQTFGLMIEEVGHWAHAFEGDTVIFAVTCVIYCYLVAHDVSMFPC